MIQIQSVRIQEFRGIRDLTLEMRCKTFVVSGPNGSGKSGVVDAIQFALTGEIARLQGAGTGDLTLAAHGPHINHRKEPERAAVHLTVFIPHLGKKATISRTIALPKHPQISPDDDEVRSVFAELARHPEITLARREIIRLILTEATKRSRDVQTLLQLDDIDVTRAVLKTTENKLGIDVANANERVRLVTEALRRHLVVVAVTSASILKAVNDRRKTLGLAEIPTLTKETTVSHGVVGSSGTGGAPSQGKESALTDLRAVGEALSGGLQRTSGDALASLLSLLGRLESEPDLLIAIKKQAFLRSGFDLAEGPFCPLCDTDWDLEALRAHLARKLARARDAEELRVKLLGAAQVVASDAERLRSLLDPLARLPEMSSAAAQRLREWSAELRVLSEGLRTAEGTIAHRKRLQAGWAITPEGVAADLRDAVVKVQARPEASVVAEARDFLVVAQERLADLQQAKRASQQAQANAERGKFAYRAYCEISEKVLLALYQEVEGDLATYYRAINEDDESEFKASFAPSKGKLGLLVDFHKKGMFPPGAYHSEGHQDGMGVCLYLALLKRVLGGRFTLAVLDDVVMSVDSQHRRRFCKLLKAQFPGTQFVITTHDEVWARQMRSEGLVDAKSTVAFNTWTVETGPVTAEVKEVWEKIDVDLAMNDVSAAASRLRRHCEYVARELAHSLGARVAFKADGAYELGDLLSAVIGRQAELLNSAAKAASSWGHAERLAEIHALKEQRTTILKAHGDEQWAINKAVHYNDWLDLTADEFRPVVTTFRALLEQFRCPQPECDSWLYVTPPVKPTDLRCDCGTIQLNLREK